MFKNIDDKDKVVDSAISFQDIFEKNSSLSLALPLQS